MHRKKSGQRCIFLLKQLTFKSRIQFVTSALFFSRLFFIDLLISQLNHFIVYLKALNYCFDTKLKKYAM
jgi:hypothetical protein